MALSLYERTANRYRRDLLRAEGHTRQRLALAYRQSLRSINQRLSNMPDDPTFRRLRLQELARQIEREIAGLTDAASREIEQGQRQMTRLGPEQAAGLVQAQAPELTASFTQLPRAAFEGMVGATGDGTPLRGVLSQYGAIAAAEAATALQNAIAQGTGPREVGRQLRKILGVLQWEAERLSRTELLRAFRESSRATYLANSDIVRGYRRRATLSSRTCVVCLALDGRFYELDRMMPSHPQCRCYMEVVLRDPYAEPTTGELGPEWFDRQDEVTQRRMLGRGKHELFAAGQLSLPDLVAEWDDPIWGPQIAEVPLRELTNRRRRAA